MKTAPPPLESPLTSPPISLAVLFINVMLVNLTPLGLVPSLTDKYTAPASLLDQQFLKRQLLTV